VQVVDLGGGVEEEARERRIRPSAPLGRGGGASRRGGGGLTRARR